MALARDTNQVPIQALRPGQVQQLSATGTAATTLNPVRSTVVRLAGTTSVRYTIGASTVVAQATDTLLPAGCVEYICIMPGEYVSIIREGVVDGIVTVTDFG